MEAMEREVKVRRQRRRRRRVWRCARGKSDVVAAINEADADHRRRA